MTNQESREYSRACHIVTHADQYWPSLVALAWVVIMQHAPSAKRRRIAMP